MVAPFELPVLFSAALQSLLCLSQVAFFVFLQKTDTKYRTQCLVNDVSV